LDTEALRTQTTSRDGVIVGTLHDDPTGALGAVSPVITACVQGAQLVSGADVAAGKKPYFLRRQDQRRAIGKRLARRDARCVHV
jgi:hypothetical protein